MRFALIATTAAAVVAVPFALAAAGPQMSSDEFLAAVRCTAYQGVSGQPSAEARYELNADAMATEKLAEGIRAFCADAIKLEKLMASV